MPESRIGAVVLNWKDAPRTLSCVANLLAQPQLDRVWVVDNEADGELASALDTADPRVELIESARNLGFSAGVNLGIRAALAAGVDKILCQNNDAELVEGALARLVHELEVCPGLGMVAPTVYLEDGSVQSSGGQFTPILMRTTDRGTRVDFLTFASVLVRAQAFSQVGLLSERFFMYWEDVEFGLRLSSGGWMMRSLPDARVVHARGASHGRVGARVHGYSTYGVVVLARTLRTPAALVGAVLRVGWRIAGALAIRDWSRAWRVCEGACLGAIGHRLGADVYPR